MRILSIALLTLVASCGSIPEESFQIQSDPAGAEVYLSRRGNRKVQASFAFLKGGIGSQDYEEDFELIGTTPMSYETPLEQVRTDATFLGFGGKVIYRFDEALLRFELTGFKPLVRHVRLDKGEIDLNVQMLPTDGEQVTE